MRLRAVFAGVAVAGVALGFAAQGEACAADALTAAKLGQKIGDVGFVDAAGKKITLDELKGAKATVVVFLSFECPVSTSYSPVLSDMKKHYADRGVSFVGVCASEAETPATVAKRATDFALAFPVYSDSQGLAVSAFKAEKTPEAFLLDHNLVLRYRGRVDDAFAARLKRNQQIKSHDLETALDEVLAGKAVSRPVAEAIGCLIGAEKQIKKDGRGHVLPRRAARSCRPTARSATGPARSGPFSLMTYQASGQLGRRHQDLHRNAADAALENHGRTAVPQRAPPERQGSRHARQVGGGRHSRGQSRRRTAAPPIRQRLATGRAGPGGHADERIRRRTGRPRFVPRLRAADQSARGQVRRRLRSQAGQPPRGPPHAQLYRHHEGRAESSRKGPGRREQNEIRTWLGPRPRLFVRHGRRLLPAGRTRRLGSRTARAADAPRLRLPLAQALGRRRSSALPSRRPRRARQAADRPLLRQVDRRHEVLQGRRDPRPLPGDPRERSRTTKSTARRR